SGPLEFLHFEVHDLLLAAALAASRTQGTQKALRKRGEEAIKLSRTCCLISKPSSSDYGTRMEDRPVEERPSDAGFVSATSEDRMCERNCSRLRLNADRH